MQNSEVHTLSFRLVRPHGLCETNHVPLVISVVQVPLKKLSFLTTKKIRTALIMRLHPSPSSTPTHTIRILIADRNRMGNQLLAESLGRDPRFDIVAAVGPAEILPVVTNLQPDLALISADFDAAAKKGLQVARTLKS